MNNNSDNGHFDKLFWFAVCCTAVGIFYLFLITFTVIPKSAERFADNCQGFFQGTIVASAIAWVLGGTPPVKKQSDTTIPVTGNNTQVTVSPSTTEPKADDAVK